jgi:Raf kinase inhibitor-like YbhB/YbcL family protein
MTNPLRSEVSHLIGLKKTFLILIPILLFCAQSVWGGGAMEITSSAFKDQGKIPIQYVMPGAGGKNISIPLAWKNVPARTKSFALSIVDPHPVAQNWVHWLVINIPKEAFSIEEGASRKKMPAGSVELKNSFGDIGYGGPQPPRGTGDHPYVVTLHALNVERLDLGVNTSLSAFKKAIEGKVIESATITGIYGR